MPFSFLRQKLSKLNSRIAGPADSFPLENRMANLVFAITIFLMTILLAVNAGLGTWVGVYILAIVIVVESVLYYFSRIHRAYKICMVISTIMAYGALAASFILKSGVDGPTIFSFLLVFQLIVAIMPLKQHLLWAVLNVFVYISLLVLEANYPSLITHAYPDFKARLIDIGTSYVVNLALIYLVVTALRNNYRKEKQLADEHASAFELQNKQLQRILEEKKKQKVYLQTLLNSIPDLIVRMDNEGRLLDFKTESEKLTNITNPLLGKSVYEVLPEEAVMYHKQFIDMALQSSQLVAYEYDIVTRSGQRRYFEARLKGNPDNEVIAIVRDITNKKKAEAETEKLIGDLMQRNNDLLQFSNIVSHNLRSPVAGIIGLAELLKLPMETKEKDQAVQMIAEAAEKLDTVIQDINTLLSSKKSVTNEFENINIRQMTEDIISSLSLQVEDAGATFHIQTQEGCEHIRSIRPYLYSILHNLITNAIKYRHPGRTPHIVINILKRGERFAIEVADNGIGIDLDKHGDKLFGLYQRFHDNIEGKGLGLHMTRTQVEALGGNISVESTPGTGTKFTVII